MDTPLAQDKLNEIKDWVVYMEKELKNERIDIQELSTIDEVYKII